jgi:hypothetical protein
LIAAIIVMLSASALRAAAPPPKPDVALGQDGKLAYVADERGNRIPDFSHAGYMGGGVAIPDVPVKVVVPVAGGDATARIQSAIDFVSGLPADEHNVRGAVLLQRGRYKVDGGLLIKTSGVVLRGSGMGEDGTVLFAAGTNRRTLIRIVGKDDRKIDSRTLAIEGYVPVGATRLRLRDKVNLKVGDTILIKRPSTAEWIKTIGMDYMGGDRHSFIWKPGSRDIAWDRVVTKIAGNEITFDAPITTALDPAFGGGTLFTYTWSGRISKVGVENLRCESNYDKDNPKDEEHSWMAVTFEATADAWVRQVTAIHFVGSAVTILESCKRITVEDCKSLAPISEIAGQRRQTFFTAGQQCLFDRSYSDQGRHDFSVGFVAAGPNAFVQCTADNALDDSGPLDSWASGVLLDNVRVDGNAITLDNRQYRSQGAGWCAANCVLWGCNASVIHCDSPPTAVNWSFGSWGSFSGDGRYVSSRESIRPISLYYAQLNDRLGDKAETSPQMMITPSDPSSSPPMDVAMQLAAASTQPAPRLSDWIDESAKRHAIPTDAAGAKVVDDLIASTPPASQPAMHKIAVKNGWIVSDNGIVTGNRQGITWWAGGVRPDDMAKVEVSPTRFVPGRIGRGLTDDLNVLTDGMREQKNVAIDYHYGLWYDTRDADHERIRRMDGDVWPPFYELPFARSGKDLAWDGLSKYDLTKYNAWYWSRLQQLALLCDQKELVLLHHHYFQHNILEAGAHWASNPWRSANNINDTGFPEPPPYVGDKRIFMAEQFYDLNQPTRRKLHEAFIRKSLDSFSDRANVIQLTSYEFTGPLHFMEFWLDTVAAWEKETGKTAIVALSCTKDVQDAILADPVRAPIVNVIDIRYWWYQAGDGTAYAPAGGKNLAPRQHERVIRHKGSSFEQVARAVREYRDKYPDKAVIYSADNDDGTGWAQLMSGGSLAQIGQTLDPELRLAIAEMKPAASPMTLEDAKGNRLVYSESSVDPKGFSSARWINTKTGKMSNEAPEAGPFLVWLKK